MSKQPAISKLLTNTILELNRAKQDITTAVVRCKGLQDGMNNAETDISTALSEVSGSIKTIVATCRSLQGSCNDLKKEVMRLQETPRGGKPVAGTTLQSKRQAAPAKGAKEASQKTLVELAEDILREQNRYLTAREIADFAVERGYKPKTKVSSRIPQPFRNEMNKRQDLFERDEDRYGLKDFNWPV